MIITIDGLSGTGKSSTAYLVASEMGYNFLGSGFIYRLYAYNENILSQDDLSQHLGFKFIDGSVRCFYNNDDLTEVLMTDKIASRASLLAKEKYVRDLLVFAQKSFDKGNGLVADGRDMGTVIFPHAPFKFYLTASTLIRAKRRVKQLKSIGIHASLSSVESQIKIRDNQDQGRAISPAIPADDAIKIDVSELSLLETVSKIKSYL